MKRRNFLLSGTASLATAGLTACGGGGGADGQAGTALPETGALRSTGPVAIDPATGGAVTAAASGDHAPSRAAKQAGTATPTASVRYPFGARLTPYSAGILPSQSVWTMDDLLRRQYDAWKAARLVPVGWIAPGGYAVQSSQWNTLTVSEAMGYGMLLTVLFAGHDPNARTIFDGLLAVVRARPAWAVTPHYAGGKYLMDWKLASNGSSMGEGWNALDGDLDIALALLMADKQWGSSSGWNYLQEAKNTIEAIKSWNVKADGTLEGLANRSHNRTSDYMTGHFRAFKAATGDGLWDKAVDRACWLSNHLQNSFSAGVGLMPDFVMNADSAWPIPSTGYIGDGNDKEGYFWWNACRNPWRFASDYVLSGDWRIQQVTGRMIDFFQRASGGDPVRIGTGYALDGRLLAGGNSGAYHGPICAGACTDARFQAFLDAMWNWNASHLTTGYYDSEIQLLSMVVASGNWWTPAAGFGSGGGSVTDGQQQTTPQQPAPAPAGGNVLANGDFASGMTNWENWGNAWIAAGALNVGTGAGGAAQQVGGKLAAGTKYQLTGTANITGPGDGVYVGIKLMDQWGGVLVDQLQAVSSQSPTGISISFTAPQGATSGYVFVWKNASGVVGVVDSLSLAPAGSGGPASQPAPTAPATGGSELLVNGNFASGMGNWENWGNSWVSGGVLNVGTGAGGVAQNIAGKITAGRKYQVGITGNLSAPSEGVFVGVKLMNSWGGVLVEQLQLVSSLAPASASIAFTAPQGATSGYVFVWKNGNGAVALVQKLSLVAVG